MGGVYTDYYITSELCHYGVKRKSGRYPWGSGERPFQGDKLSAKAIKLAQKGKKRDSNYFTQDRTIPKGTTMYRTTPMNNEKDSGYKYVTYIQEDRDLYRGSYADSIKENYGKSEDSKLYENTYTLKSDLKIPSRATLKQAQLAAMSDPKVRKDAIDSYSKKVVKSETLDLILNYGEDWEKEAKIWEKQISNDFMSKYGSMTPDELFILNSRAIATSPSYRNAVINNLKKKGYNAMVDEGGVGGVGDNFREGIDPLIVFESKDSLNKTSTKEIDSRTMRRADMNYVKWTTKANKKRKPGTW